MPGKDDWADATAPRYDLVINGETHVFYEGDTLTLTLRSLPDGLMEKLKERMPGVTIEVVRKVIDIRFAEEI